RRRGRSVPTASVFHSLFWRARRVPRLDPATARVLINAQIGGPLSGAKRKTLLPSDIPVLTHCGPSNGREGCQFTAYSITSVRVVRARGSRHIHRVSSTRA